MSFFLYLSKELPGADRITANPSSRYNPTLVKSMFLWISVSMYNPTSSHISAPSLAPIDMSNWFFSFLGSKRFLCGRVGYVYIYLLSCIYYYIYYIYYYMAIVGTVMC